MEMLQVARSVWWSRAAVGTSAVSVVVGGGALALALN
jgi:hypothetical protein